MTTIEFALGKVESADSSSIDRYLTLGVSCGGDDAPHYAHRDFFDECSRGFQISYFAVDGGELRFACLDPALSDKMFAKAMQV